MMEEAKKKLSVDKKAKASPAKSKVKRLLSCLVIILIILAVICGIYLGNYYHADETALQYAQTSTQTVTVDYSHKNEIVFVPQETKAGIIFYPGGKVAYESYAPLLHKLAEQGILCVLLDMPGNLAVFDVNAADGIQAQYPEIEDWYMAGHSLGGAMAASYVSKYADEYQGIIFLGAYTTADLSQTNLRALSIYGDQDQVLKLDSYRENAINQPSDFTEYIIPGGCHAYFGSYGPQKGDGNPTISPEEQWDITSATIVGWMFVDK